MSNFYNIGNEVVRVQHVGAPINRSGMASILATVGIGGLVIYAMSRKPRISAGPDMRDVNARLRARGRDPRSYGW